MIGVGKRKRATLSSQDCRKMEMLRLAVEVLTVSRVAFKELDLIEGKGLLTVEGAEKYLSFVFDNDTQARFSLNSFGEKAEWYTANFHQPHTAKIIAHYKPSQENNLSWLVGTSKDNRWEEPLF